MLQLFHTVIYEPLYNLLIWLYNTIPGQDLGIAIIVLTLITKFILLPLSRKQIESQKQLQELQPEIKKIQKKNKDNKEKQAKELMAFYKENNVNPFSGCLPLIVQLIILIGIYQIILQLSKMNLVANGDDLYEFVSNPGEINHFFIGLVNLTEPNYVLAVLAAGAQYVQVKMMMKNREDGKKDEPTNKDKKEEKKDGDGQSKEDMMQDFAQVMQKQMVVMLPIITLIIGITFPAGLALYWLISTLFMIAQQWVIMNKKDNNKKVASAD